MCGTRTDGATRNDDEYRFFGLRRSGHHAVLSWLAHHYGDNQVLFLNDCRPRHDPFRACYIGRSFPTSSPCFIPYRSRRDLDRLRNSPRKCLILNYEDHVVGSDYCRPGDVGPSRRTWRVVVLRDPFNLMASRWRMRDRGRVRAKQDQEALRIWKQHARIYLGLDPASADLVCVNYDRWFLGEGYRRELAARFGLEWTDRGLNEVLRFGGGSSFDRMALNGRAQTMAVLHRWERYKDEAAFLALFDGETHALAAAAFAGIEALDGILCPKPTGEASPHM